MMNLGMIRPATTRIAGLTGRPSIPLKIYKMAIQKLFVKAPPTGSFGPPKKYILAIRLKKQYQKGFSRPVTDAPAR